MCDLQAIIDFQVELHKFINIDLFQRGLYQIRINHHINSKIPHKIEVSFLEDSSKKKDNLVSSNIVFQPVIVNGVAISKTFQILYKNEEVILNDVIKIKDHLIVDSANCLKQLSSVDFNLDVELWFSESSFVPNNQDLLFRRQLKLHFNVHQGLHYHLPISFDYFHLSAVTISVHACLVTLCLPYLSKQSLKLSELEPSNRGLGYDQLFFGCTFNEIQNQIRDNCTELLKLRQKRAQLLHWQLCSILLTSIQNLGRKFDEYLKKIPSLIRSKYIKDRSLTHFQLTNLSKLAQKCHQSCLENGLKSCSQDFMHFQNVYFAKEILKDKELNKNLIDEEIKRVNDENQSDNSKENQPITNLDENINKGSSEKLDKNSNKVDELSIYQPEDYIASIVTDLAYICGCQISIWQSFIKLITHNEKVNQHLARIHHLHRCKRFSEAFFVKEKPASQLISDSFDNFVFYVLGDKLRKSKYLQSLPVCQIECTSLDGDQNTMPIIFEEKFNFKKSHSIDQKEKVLRRSSSDISTNSSLTSSSLNSATNTSSSGTENTNHSAAHSTNGKPKSSFKLKDKIVLNLNKLNLNSNIITRRKSSISYLPKQEQQKIALNETLSTSSSTNNSNNSSLNTQSTENKSLNVDNLNQSETVVDSPRIVVDSVNVNVNENTEASLKSALEQTNRLARLNSFKHYNDVNGKPEEFLMENGYSSIYSIVETISLNNIKLTNDNKIKKKKLASSESLPDLNVKRLQKTIKRMSKKNSKKSKKERKESSSFKRVKSADYSIKNKGEMLIDSLLLNIDSLNKTNLDLDEKDEFSDLESYIDEDEKPIDKNDENSSDKAKPKKNDKKLIKKRKDKLTILEMFTNNTCLVCGNDCCNCIQDCELSNSSKNLSIITNELVQFVKAKEKFRQEEVNTRTNNWSFYSDFSNPFASRIPYFQYDDLCKTANSKTGIHLVVCVHGLDGNCADLRLVKTYLELLLPLTNFDFLMSESNQGKTYDSFENMTNRLCDEILRHIQVNGLQPTKVSFIGHSLGNIIIRSVLRKPELDFLLPKLHCFLSLSGPHLGTIYMTNNLVNIGLWFMQKWKKSNSILQLTLKDDVDPYKTFIYNLSKDSKLNLFKYVLLFGSSQDHYVPIHSAHIRDCNQSAQDCSLTGQVYRDMINNILSPFLSESSGSLASDSFIDVKNTSTRCKELIRYDVLHADGGGTNALIGRQAHIAVLDCELFIEKFISISGLKYFE